MITYVQDVIDRLTVKLPGCPYELTKLYALLVLNSGLQTTLEDVHNAWSVWQNDFNPEHKSLIPFELLTTQVQELDRKYAEAIWQTWLDIQADNC